MLNQIIMPSNIVTSSDYDYKSLLTQKGGWTPAEWTNANLIKTEYLK